MVHGVALLSSLLWSLAPTGGKVSGTVRDSSGGSLPGAEVLVLDRNGGEELQKATADAEGRYHLTLPAGAYVLRAGLDLFQPVSTPVVIAEARSVEVDFTLPLAALAERVTVSGDVKGELSEVPGSVGYVGQAAIEDSLAYNLEDTLAFMPGVLVQPRFGADESQISIRGSGLRGNFHLRGVNLFLNGLPYQDAYGFGDFESIDLMGGRGDRSLEGRERSLLRRQFPRRRPQYPDPHRRDRRALSVVVPGRLVRPLPGAGLGGRRPRGVPLLRELLRHRARRLPRAQRAGRKRVFSNLGWNLDEKTDLRVDFIYADVSEKLPGSLTREELLSDPRKADPVNVAQDWGRFYDYFRVGAGVTRAVGEGQRVDLSVSTQLRDMVHPIFQVLDNESLNFGFDAAYYLETEVGGRANDLVIGFSPHFRGVEEKRYENVAGQAGALTAEFETDASNLGLFFENRLSLRENLRFVFGGRADRARREFRDRLLTDGDRSDARTFQAFVPKLGLVWDRSDAVQVYGNVSRAYEPPLLLELTSFGSPGFLDLKAQDSWQLEVGSRGSHGERVRWDVAFFDAEIRDEILNVNVRPFPGAPFTIPSYRNADRTRHLGLELGLEIGFEEFLSPGGQLRWRNAYTWSRFRFVDDLVYGDNALPGAPEHMLRTELRYDHPGGFWLAPNVEWSPSPYFVDSSNQVENEGYAVLNLRAGYDLEKISFFLQGTNLTDRVYSGSVQVDNANGRFFEPSNGRSIFVGLRFRL